VNAIEVLHQMHEEAKATFQKLEQCDPKERQHIWHELQPTLVFHEDVEEQFLYHPVANEFGDRDQKLRDYEMHHSHEVQQAVSKISSLAFADITSDHWLEHLRELKTTLEHHIQEEEGEIWPRIQQLWGDDKLTQAGAGIQAKLEVFKNQAIHPAA
jgi:hypothetical protein